MFGLGEVYGIDAFLLHLAFTRRLIYLEAMSTIWRTWTQRSGLYTNDNEVLTHLSRRFKLEVIN